MQQETSTTYSEQCRGQLTNEAREMIEEHLEIGLRIAIQLLRGWNIRMPKNEIESLVHVSLCEAALSFRSDRGTRFSTFLYYYLRGNLLKTVSSNCNFQKSKAATLRAHGLTSTKQSDTEEADLVVHEVCEQPSPEATVLSLESSAVVRKCLASLEPELRTVLLTTVVEGKTLQEASRILNRSRSQAHCLLMHAYAALREKVAQAGLVEQPPVPEPRSSNGRRWRSSQRRRRSALPVLRSTPFKATA